MSTLRLASRMMRVQNETHAVRGSTSIRGTLSSITRSKSLIVHDFDINHMQYGGGIVGWSYTAHSTAGANTKVGPGSIPITHL